MLTLENIYKYIIIVVALVQSKSADGMILLEYLAFFCLFCAYTCRLRAYLNLHTCITFHVSADIMFIDTKKLKQLILVQ